MHPLTAHHVGLTVNDLERTLPFYRDVLGLEVLDRFSVSGDGFADAVDVAGATGRFAHLDAGDLRLELVEYDPVADGNPSPALNQPGATHLGLAVDDLDALFEAIPDEIETLSEPRTTESGAHICFLRDPEGNLVELLEI